MAHVATRPTDALSALTSAQHGLPVPALIAVKFAVCVTKWTARRRSRLALKQMPDWQLRDVGLTPAQAHREASLVFWRT